MTLSTRVPNAEAQMEGGVLVALVPDACLDVALVQKCKGPSVQEIIWATPKMLHDLKPYMRDRIVAVVLMDEMHSMGYLLAVRAFVSRVFEGVPVVPFGEFENVMRAGVDMVHEVERVRDRIRARSERSSAVQVIPDEAMQWLRRLWQWWRGEG